MKVTNCTKQDFDQILLEFNQFWDNDRTVALHRPTMIYEFGNSAFVIRDGDRVLAYLMGFLSQTEPVGYVQLLSVRRGCRKQGLARQLYGHFTKFALAHGCRQLKAITSPVNKLSIAFHKSIGMTLADDDTVDGVLVVKNYAGPGKDRVVFMKNIGQTGK